MRALLGIHVRGHVLVIRHGARNHLQVTNVLHAEHRFIDVLVRRYVLSYDVITSAHSSQPFQPDSNQFGQLRHRLVGHALCTCRHIYRIPLFMWTCRKPVLARIYCPITGLYEYLCC